MQRAEYNTPSISEKALFYAWLLWTFLSDSSFTWFKHVLATMQINYPKIPNKVRTSNKVWAPQKLPKMGLKIVKI